MNTSYNDSILFDSNLDTIQHNDNGLAVGTLQKFQLLFQAGYLTIASHVSFADKYTLRIPNIEVQREFHNMIIEVMKSSSSCVDYGRKITENFNDLKFPELTEVYNNFIRERYGMRVWNTAKDKEGKCQLMFGNALMLSGEFTYIIYENDSIKRDNGETGFIDIYLKFPQKYKAIVDCKYDDIDMEACMNQTENYSLPSWETDTITFSTGDKDTKNINLYILGDKAGLSQNVSDLVSEITY